VSTRQKNAFSHRSWPGPDSCVHSPFPATPSARSTGRASLQRQTAPGPNWRETIVERRRFCWRTRLSLPPATATPRATEQKGDGEPTCSGPGILSHLRTLPDGKLLHSTDGRLSRQSGRPSREQRSASAVRGDFSRLFALPGVGTSSLGRRGCSLRSRGAFPGSHREERVTGSGVRTVTLFEKPERLW
jgi:hypothetical protein